jgi:hypothetical protein
MQGTFDVATAGRSSDPVAVRNAARDVDLFLDWLAMRQSSDLSFVLDPRYRALLTDEDAEVALRLKPLRDHYAAGHNEDPSELDHAVHTVLRRLGGA